MKPFVIVLIVLFFLLQYKLWIEKDSFWYLQRLKQQITQQTQENVQLSQRNGRVLNQIEDLKLRKTVLEAHARKDLNMIKANEVFYLIVGKDKLE